MLTVGTTATFTATTVLDSVTDDGETIVFTLAAGTGYTLGAGTTVSVSIGDVPDTDGDSMPDITDPDDDNDGIPDAQEATGQQLIPDCGGTPTAATRVQDGTQGQPLLRRYPDRAAKHRQRFPKQL